jgi:hypothetical protein
MDNDVVRFGAKRKDFWATLFIAAGFLVKLYGIVGLAFSFFRTIKLSLHCLLYFGYWYCLHCL